MDHYFSGMNLLTSKERFDLQERYFKDQQKRILEISQIIDSNSIRTEDIKIGETLKLFHPLLLESRLDLMEFSKPPIIREAFSIDSELYIPEMGILASSDNFTAYDKNDQLQSINIYPTKGKRPLWGFGSNWINIRFFEKQ